MNERINKLRLDAGISRLHDQPKFMVAVNKEGIVIEPLDGLQKFAELIVRECVAVMKQHNFHQRSHNAMLEHFGVE